MISVTEEAGWNSSANLDSSLEVASHHFILKQAASIIAGLDYKPEDLAQVPKKALHDLQIAYKTQGKLFILTKGIHQRDTSPHLTFRVEGLNHTYHLVLRGIQYDSLFPRIEWRGVQFTVDIPFSGTDVYPVSIPSTVSTRADSGSSSATPAAALTTSGANPSVTSSAVATSATAASATAESLAPLAATEIVATGTVLPPSRIRGRGHSFSSDMYASVFKEQTSKDRKLKINSFKQKTLDTISKDYQLPPRALAGLGSQKSEVVLVGANKKGTFKAIWDGSENRFIVEIDGKPVKEYGFTG